MMPVHVFSKLPRSSDAQIYYVENATQWDCSMQYRCECSQQQVLRVNGFLGKQNNSVYYFSANILLKMYNWQIKENHQNSKCVIECWRWCLEHLLLCCALYFVSQIPLALFLLFYDLYIFISHVWRSLGHKMLMTKTTRALLPFHLNLESLPFGYHVKRSLS